MKNLLVFEFHKLFRKKSFYICTAIMLALLAVGLLISKSIYNTSDVQATENYGLSLFLSAVGNSSFTMICGIFTALFICEDFDSNTIKNIYSRGYSRKKVFIAKGITVLFSTVIMLTAVLALCGIIVYNQFGSFTMSLKAVSLIIGQYIFCIADTSFVLSAGFALKKSGITIAIAILGLSIGGTLISLADTFLKFDNFLLSDYWLGNFGNSFMSLATDNGKLTVCITASVIYTLIFTLSGIILSKKSE